MNMEIFNFLHSFAGKSQFFDSLVVFIANPFGYILIGISYLYLIFHTIEDTYVFKKIGSRITQITILSLSVGLALLFSHIIKILVQAPRPFIVLSDINELFLYGSYDSFPSGHATLFSALAVAIFMYHRKMGMFFICGAILIGLSRIIVGIHFPIDILAGFILGGTLSWATYYTTNIFISKFFPKIDFLSKKP